MEILAIKQGSTDLTNSSFTNFSESPKGLSSPSEEKKIPEFNFDLDELRNAVSSVSLSVLPSMDDEDAFDAWLDS